METFRLHFRIVGGTAVTYFLLGIIGLTLGTASGFASPVFPAAGLALAYALWFRGLALKGIWLGAALVNLLPTLMNAHLSGTAAAMSLAIASGATAQAWAGLRLIESRLGASWRTLEREKDAIGFLLFGGLLAGLVSASVGATTLSVAGIIGGSEFLMTWWNWYVGDVLGILVFAPLTLCLLSKEGLWQDRRRQIVVPMLLILVVVWVAFFGISRWERQTQQTQINESGEAIARRITDRLISHREVLSSLGRFIETTPDFTFHQFEQFTLMTLEGNPDIFALSFNDLVPLVKRPAYERLMSRLSPLGRFQITERGRDQQLVRAATRPEYVAVRYIVPLEKNRTAVGFDINSEPIRRSAIARARAIKRMSVTAPIQLVQEQEKRIGLLELLPVFSWSPPGAQARGPRLCGFAVAVLKVDEMIAIATRGHVPAGLQFQLTDPLAPPGHDLLYRSGTRGLPEPGEEQTADWETELRMGDRRWVLSVYATTEYQRQRQPWMAWSVGILGLMIAALLQILMLGVTGRTAVMKRKNEEIQTLAHSLEEKVGERTAQLTEANRQLTAEIAERKLAEEALKEREGKINAIFQNTVDGIVSITEDNIIETFNPAAERIFGYSAQEAIGQNLTLLMPEPLKKSHDHYIAEYLKNRVSKVVGATTEVTARRKDGTLFQAEISVSEVIVGERRLFTGLVRDVTERKKAERALQRSEAQVRLLLDSTAEAIYGVDLEGHCTFANAACLRMLGYKDKEQLLGRNMHELVHYAYADGRPMPEQACRIYQAFREGKGMHADDEVLWRADGVPIPVEYWSYPQIVNGEVRGAVMTFIDITERKQYEKQLKEARETAEAATRAKSEFLASMSHEIRTPMNAIIGIADLLHETHLTEEQERYVDVFRKSGKNLLTVINDILDFSKIEAGQITLEAIPFNLPGLLNEVVETMAVKAAESGVALSCAIAPGTDADFVGDPARLRQILLNIVGNALKFTPAGSGRIAVEKAEGPAPGPAETEGSRWLRFSVQDTGIGIPAAMIDKIFDKFTQVDSSFSRKFGGTGLGLPICRHLVTLMGGKIWVESKERVGSTFSFTVRLQTGQRVADKTDGKKSQEQPPTAPADAGVVRPLRILLAEDNEDNRLLFLMYLKRLPYDVDIAVNGQEAVEKVRTGQKYDIIFMDVQMPVMDGYRATEEIRRMEQETGARPMPIIALTAHAFKEDIQKSRNAGCDAHVTKPVSRQILLDAIREFITEDPKTAEST